MLLLLALATMQPVAVEKLPSSRQARATVRLLRPATLRFGEIEHAQPARLRTIRNRDAAAGGRPLRVIEFE